MHGIFNMNKKIIPTYLSFIEYDPKELIISKARKIHDSKQELKHNLADGHMFTIMRYTIFIMLCVISNFKTEVTFHKTAGTDIQTIIQ